MMYYFVYDIIIIRCVPFPFVTARCRCPKDAAYKCVRPTLSDKPLLAKAKVDGTGDHLRWHFSKSGSVTSFYGNQLCNFIVHSEKSTKIFSTFYKKKQKECIPQNKYKKQKILTKYYFLLILKNRREKTSSWLRHSWNNKTIFFKKHTKFFNFTLKYCLEEGNPIYFWSGL